MPLAMLSTALVKRKPIVWLVNEGGHDYRLARKWGRIVPLTAGNINPFQVDRLIVNLSQRLQMAQENDFIVVSGVALTNMLVLAIWLAKFPRANILQWAVQGSRYIKLTIDRENLYRHANNPLGPAE